MHSYPVPPPSPCHTNLENIFDHLANLGTWPRTYHADQLFLSEFSAVHLRQILFHIDMDVEARNTVVVKAQQLQNCVVEAEEVERVHRLQVAVAQGREPRRQRSRASALS